MESHDSKIIIVGAGVFGLSTALWLSRAGYKDITVFDRCPLDTKHYNPSDGCDGASADINKIFRTAYGTEKEYQNLAIEARKLWLSWNQEISESPASDLPLGLAPDDKVLDLCGNFFLAEGPELRQFYKDSLSVMEKLEPECRKLQFVKGDKDDEERLRQIDPKWVETFHAIDGINNNNTNGFLDIQGGVTLADKACIYARFLCEKAGVRFVLGSPQGQLKTLIVANEGNGKQVTGIQTYDGKSHHGDIVIVACGGWTASVIPEAARTVETTAGTLMFIDVPKERKDIWDKFDSKHFPAWSYRRGEGDEYYQGGGGSLETSQPEAGASSWLRYIWLTLVDVQFPITKEGRLKFGFRGRKPLPICELLIEPGIDEQVLTVCTSRVSTPKTKYTHDPIKTVPLYGLQLVKEVIGKAFPELAEFGFTDFR
ncbi:hypothetical protein H2204_000280, partial [Knufia peltigerae]